MQPCLSGAGRRSESTACLVVGALLHWLVVIMAAICVAPGVSS